MKRARDGASAQGRETGFPYLLTEEAGGLRVVAQFDGVDEESIRIDLEGRTLVISARGKGKQYRMAIALPWAARLGKKRFGRGVLDLCLERPS